MSLLALIEQFVRLNNRTLTTTVKTAIFGVILLGIVGVFVYQELSRRSLLADKRAVETELTEARAKISELETERDKLLSAVSAIERQRQLSLDTAATLRIIQKELRTSLAEARMQLKQSTNREQRCLDALAEAHKLFPR